MTEVRINMRKIRNSSIPTWLGLVVGSWFGLAWGALVSLPVGVGFGVIIWTALGGFLLVPVWGTFWGLVGLGGQRAKAVASHGIRVLPADDELTRRVHAMAGKLGLKTAPWVAVMPHANAYAIGANASNALVVLGSPLEQILTEEEVDAIMGHELGHVANNDMRRMGLARSFQNSLVWYLGFSKTVQDVGRWSLTWLSELATLHLSRNREYWADAIGAALTSKEAMISALEKLHQMPSPSGFERRHARLMVRGRPAPCSRRIRRWTSGGGRFRRKRTCGGSRSFRPRIFRCKLPQCRSRKWRILLMQNDRTYPLLMDLENLSIVWLRDTVVSSK